MDMQEDIIAKLDQYKGLIFDLDGTIVDLGVNWENLKEALSRYCFYKKRVHIVFKALDKELAFAKVRFGDRFYSELLDIVSQFEMIETKYRFNKRLLHFINNLKDKKFAIYSMNTMRCIKHIVEKYLKNKPDIIISKETYIEPKPTVKDLLFIIDAWQFKKKQVAFVGNSKQDVLCGKKANVETYIIQT